MIRVFGTERDDRSFWKSERLVILDTGFLEEWEEFLFYLTASRDDLAQRIEAVNPTGPGTAR